MHGAVHGRDGREVDDLHVAAEVAVAHDLPRRVRMHADDAAVAQVEHVAAIQLRAGSALSAPDHASTICRTVCACTLTMRLLPRFRAVQPAAVRRGWDVIAQAH